MFVFDRSRQKKGILPRVKKQDGSQLLLFVLLYYFSLRRHERATHDHDQDGQDEQADGRPCGVFCSDGGLFFQSILDRRNLPVQANDSLGIHSTGECIEAAI
jgi:hypothetical protein